jgi:hypothetical protein
VDRQLIVQDLSETFPQIVLSDSLSEALDFVTRFHRCQIYDPNTGIVRVYDEDSELKHEDHVMHQEDF